MQTAVSQKNKGATMRMTERMQVPAAMSRRGLRATALVSVLMCAAFAARAEVRLPAIFGDHMVLQSERPIPVWGSATAGAEVSVSLGGHQTRAHADAAGYWSVTLPAMPASTTPMTLEVSEQGAAHVTLQDVLVGEVWLAGGQSNMAYPLDAMQGKEAVLAKAANPEIRLFLAEHETAAEPEGMKPGLASGDVKGHWVVSDAKSAGAFSAVAFLVAQQLQDRLKRPVGMISSNWGGTPIQTWMRKEAFASQPSLTKYVTEYEKAQAVHRELAADPANDAKYKADWKQWRTEVGDAFDVAMKQWNAANESGHDPGPRPKQSRPEPKNPDPTGVPLGGYRPNAPAVCWNAMLQPLTPFAMRGVLWYQGEANVSHWAEYGLLLRTMVADWRQAFAQPDLDFLVVQLPANGANDAKRDLARLREAQASVLTLPHTAIAVTFDVGDPGNVHPASKVDVGHRLALAALGEAYHLPVAYLGPRYASAKREGASLRVTFRDAANGLHIAQTPWLSVHTVPFPTDRLIGFEIAGEDKVFHAAEARIEGNSVLLTAADVPQPVYVRYAFDESPRANLYDGAGLPAAPFRTDP